MSMQNFDDHKGYQSKSKEKIIAEYEAKIKDLFKKVSEDHLEK